MKYPMVFWTLYCKNQSFPLVEVVEGYQTERMDWSHTKKAAYFHHLVLVSAFAAAEVAIVLSGYLEEEEEVGDSGRKV